jgi:protein-tyrosine phosphatase
LKAQSIIFVCLGNICRSPLAEGIAKKYAQQYDLDIHIESAGTGSWHVGEAPCANSIQVAKLNGIDISKQKARQITTNDFEKFDLVVALDDSNIHNLRNVSSKEVLKLGDFGYNGKDVPDPYYFDGFEGFHEVYKMIDICVDTLLKKII